MTTANSKNTKLLTLIILLLIILSGIFYLLNINDKKPELTNNNQQTNNNSQELKPIIPNWKVYADKEYGFRIDYPKEWAAKETGKYAREYAAISLVSPETQKDFEENFEQIKDFYAGNFNEYFAYNSDMSVYVYSSLKNRHGVATIKEWIENNNEISEIGKIEISEIEATEFIQHGESIKYAIIFENNGYFYEIILNKASSKEDISDIIKQILSTFQLIK
jgi:hypothetical protein